MRLIDADALKEELNELRKSPWFETNVNGILERASYTARREALNIVEKLCIDNAPTVERPQGEWLHPYTTDVACECSICHVQMPTYRFNFCPNCGADMRGK